MRLRLANTTARRAVPSWGGDVRRAIEESRLGRAGGSQGRIFRRQPSRPGPRGLSRPACAGAAGDAHQRVAGATLAALAAALRAGGRLFEPHLDRLMPPLFVRAADNKVRPRKL